MQIDGPAEVEFARAAGGHLPVEDGRGFETVVDDVSDAGVAPVEDRGALVLGPVRVEPVEGRLDERVSAARPSTTHS